MEVFCIDSTYLQPWQTPHIYTFAVGRTSSLALCTRSMTFFSPSAPTGSIVPQTPFLQQFVNSSITERRNVNGVLYGPGSLWHLEGPFRLLLQEQTFSKATTAILAVQGAVSLGSLLSMHLHQQHPGSKIKQVQSMRADTLRSDTQQGLLRCP